MRLAGGEAEMPPGGVVAPASRVSDPARSWRLGKLADDGTLLAPNSHPPGSPEPPNAERIAAFVPGHGGPAGLYFRNAPVFRSHERHNVLNLRPRRARITEKRLI